MLTASHVINWTGGDEGGVSWVTFAPGYFDGSGPWGEIAATHVIYWIQAPGTLSDEQTAFDYAVLVMSDPIGDVVGYPGYRTYNERWNGESYWQCIGYPGELASGERPAFQGAGVVSSVGDQHERTDGLRHGALQRIHPGAIGRYHVGLVGRRAVTARRRGRQHDRQHRRPDTERHDDR